MVTELGFGVNEKKVSNFVHFFLIASLVVVMQVAAEKLTQVLVMCSLFLFANGSKVSSCV